MNEATEETSTLLGSGDLSKDEFFCLPEWLHLYRILQSVWIKDSAKLELHFVTFLSHKSFHWGCEMQFAAAKNNCHLLPINLMSTRYRQGLCPTWQNRRCERTASIEGCRAHCSLLNPLVRCTSNRSPQKQHSQATEALASLCLRMVDEVLCDRCQLQAIPAAAYEENIINTLSCFGESWQSGVYRLGFECLIFAACCYF